MSFNQTNEIIKKEIQTFNARRSLGGALAIIIATFILNIPRISAYYARSRRFL